MPDEREEPCEVCHGDRTVTVDCFTPSRGHFTIEEACEKCGEDEYREFDDADDLGPLEKWWPGYTAERTYPKSK